MDYISEFDIRLEREMYYAGEILSGRVILNTSENFKLKGEAAVSSLLFLLVLLRVAFHQSFNRVVVYLLSSFAAHDISRFDLWRCRIAKIHENKRKTRSGAQQFSRTLSSS